MCCGKNRVADRLSEQGCRQETLQALCGTLTKTIEGQGLSKPDIVVGFGRREIHENGLCKKKSPQLYAIHHSSITAN
jgi:hypothetical protein